MQFLFGIINKPLGWVLEFIAGLTGGSFAAAVFIFTVLINLALIPLSIKSQKSSVQQTRIKPKLDELKKQCGDDRQKYSMEMQNLYREENVSMSGGCLPMILRLVLMLSIYYLILSPLTYMTGVESDRINNVSTTISTAMSELREENKEEYDKLAKKINWNESVNSRELNIVSIIRNDSDILKEILSEDEYDKIKDDLEYITKKDKEADIDYSFITSKINLTQTPKFSFDIFHDAQLIWIMPILAFAAQMLSSIISMKIQKRVNPDAPNMMGMMLFMPLVTLFIGFGFPSGVAFYWTCSSIVGGLIQAGVQTFYGPNKMLARQRGKELVKQYEFEAGQVKKLGQPQESQINGEESK